MPSGGTSRRRIVELLLASTEPCIRYRTATEICGIPENDARVQTIRNEIPVSERVRRILSLRGDHGRYADRHVYAKYTGAHWALADLASVCYPPGDRSLVPLRNQVYEFWLRPEHTRERIVESESKRYKSVPGVPVIAGRARRCASQEGNALYATLALGIADKRAVKLAENLIQWQWPDGGWNCDRRTEAATSSFHESLLPLRGLSWLSRSFDFDESITNRAKAAAARTAEFFLSRRLFRHKHDDTVIREEFLRMRFPHYWQYDILIALKVAAESGFICDPRCSEALDIVEAQELPTGGWRATGSHSKPVEAPEPGGTMTPWGTISHGKFLNEFVTVEALSVLRSAGRLDEDFANLVSL